MIEYRLAAISEVQDYIRLLDRMVEGTKFLPLTPAKAERLATRQNGFCMGAWDGDRLVGFINGYVGETFLNEEFNAYEQGWYVLPEYRGGTIALRLIKAFEGWAKGRGAAKLWLGQSVNHRQDSTLRFFERLGYECQGFITCKDL